MSEHLLTRRVSKRQPDLLHLFVYLYLLSDLLSPAIICGHEQLYQNTEEKFPDPIEHAIGEEKIMLILKEKGIDVSIVSLVIIQLNNEHISTGPLLPETNFSRLGPRNERQAIHRSFLRTQKNGWLCL